MGQLRINDEIYGSNNSADILYNNEKGNGIQSTNVKEAIDEISSFSSKLIADQWSSEKQYQVGDYVVYNNVLYKCIGEIKAGWYGTPKEEYTWNTKGELIIKGSYSYTKYNDGTAYGGYTTTTGGYTEPCLVAETYDDCRFIRNGSTPDAPSAVEVHGKTFYLHCTWGYGGSTISDGRAKKIPYIEDKPTFVESILNISGIQYAEGIDPASNPSWQEVFIADEIQNGSYDLPIASTETLGGIKVGSNLTIAEDGTLNAAAGGGNANEKELTWEEYLALSEEEKANGTTYYITDKDPVSTEKNFKSTLLATLSETAQTIDFSKYDLILYQVYNNEVNLYNSAVFLPEQIKKSSNIILPINVTDRIMIDSTNAIVVTGFNCVVDVYGLSFLGNITNSTNIKEYSTEEQVIGIWINGKPLYEKTMVLTVNYTAKDIDLSDMNIEMMRVTGVSVASDYQLPISYYQSSEDRAMAFYMGAQKVLRIKAGSSYGQGTWYLVLRYTKTTDNATK